MNNLSIDVYKCTACRACELACSFVHEGVFSPALSRIRVVRFLERGVNVPVVCVNCARPACADACPTGAAYIDRSVPVVRINEEDCIGCGECVRACPLGAADLNLDKGIAFICDLCNGAPVCIDNCTYGALTFAPARSIAQGKRRLIAAAHMSSD